MFVNSKESICQNNTNDRYVYIFEDNSKVVAQCCLVDGNTKDNLGLYKLQNMELGNSTPLTKTGDGYFILDSTEVCEGDNDVYSIVDLDVSKKYCVRTKSSDLRAGHLCCVTGTKTNVTSSSLQTFVNYYFFDNIIENSDKLYICVPKDLGMENVNLVEVATSTGSTTTYGTDTLTATVTPTNANNKNVTWSVDNSNVELVPDGLNCTVKAKATGNSVVTCTSQDTTNGTISDTCNVTIS